MNIKDIKKGDFFTVKPIAEPAENQVWIKGDYDRATKSYICTCFADISKSKAIKAGKEIYTDFTF